LSDPSRTHGSALAQFQRDFHRVMERLPDGVLILQSERVAYMNAALLGSLGYDHLADVVGRPMAELLPEGEHTRLGQLLARERPTPEGEPPDELRMLRQDGRAVVLEVHPVQMSAAEGEAFELWVVRDVTERTRLQQQLMLADRMASLGTLAAGVAHEVNNPLAYTLISLQTIRRTADALRPEVPLERAHLERLHEALRAAEHGVERVRTIVGDLRTFSRPDDETIRPVDVHRVLESAISMSNSELRPRAVLRRDYGRVPAVMANDARLGQVFLNLLVNAAQAFGGDDPRANTIQIRTEASTTDHVTIEVADNGPGIPPEILEHVFVPFVTTKPSGEGTGLGLSICHRIVTRLGGQIGVESTPGKGTVVRVVLPAAHDAPADVPEPAAPQAHASEPRGRILIVDDEPVLLTTLSAMLAPAHDVVTAASGAEAIARLEQDAGFDLILCDLMMSKMTGAQMYEAVREAQPGLEGRIAFMTGGAYTDGTRRFLASIDNACLDKPFGVEDVLALVRERLSGTGA
jgi:two-component system, cell cycle sensor histidine kinase and response regulator CckA